MTVGVMPRATIIFSCPNVEIILWVGMQSDIAVAEFDMVFGGFFRTEEPVGLAPDTTPDMPYHNLP